MVFHKAHFFCCIVLDETTYYFSAFAIDQNNNIIDSQTLSITTDFGWHVTPNTYVYYSFDDQNLNDGSGNGRNGSRRSGAGSYVEGVKGYGIQNGNRGIQLPFSMFNGDFTFSICVYLQSRSPTIQTLFGSVEWNRYLFHFHCVANLTLGFESAGNKDSGVQLDLNKWNNVILTRNGNTWKIYKNGVQVLSTDVSITISGGTRLVGCGYNDDRHVNGKLDEVIIETRAWTQEEITDYVNKLNLS